MKLNYDNLEDAKTKLLGTYCMYKSRAIVVKVVQQVPDAENKYSMFGTYMYNSKNIECLIDDPNFNCSNYNIGYVNLMRAAGWFYRIPMKQWRQGLRHDQVRAKFSNRAFSDMGLNASKATANMLENTYPKFKESVDFLKGGDATIVAFHKDFAMTFDRLHGDFVLEYKGANIGCTNNLKDFKLMDEYTHLMEALQEAVK